MTLRLVSDRDEPGEVLYCRHGTCRWGWTKPATILVSFCDGPYLPSCDECARQTWENHPNSTRLAPLAEYTDMFAAAKEATLATPEPASVQIVGSTPVDDKVLRRIWLDRVIYCRLHWCEMQGRLTPADQRLNVIGGLWFPACAECVSKFDPSEVEAAPLSEEDTAWELEMVDKYAQKQRWKEPRPPMRRETKILWWTIPAGVLALGITMVCLAGKIDSDYIAADDRWLNSHGAFHLGPVPDTSDLRGWGIFFIVVSSLVLAGVFIAYVISEATSVPAGQFHVPRQAETASQSTASAPRGVAVSDITTTAALWSAWGYAEHQRRKHHREAIAGIQAGSAAYRAEQDRRQQQATQEAILGQLQQLNAGPDPFTNTGAALDKWHGRIREGGPENPLTRNGLS